MKKICLLSMLYLLSLLTLKAQNIDQAPVKIEAKADSITEELSKLIALSHEQKEEVQLTWKEYLSAIQKVQENDQLKKRDLRRSYQRYEQERELKMKGILNEDQYSEYTAFLENTLSSHTNIL